MEKRLMPKAPIPMGALNFNPPLPETKASSKEVNLHPRFCVFLAVFHVLCDVMVHGAAFHLAFFRSPIYRTYCAVLLGCAATKVSTGTLKCRAIFVAVASVGPPPFFQRFALPLLSPSSLITVVAFCPFSAHNSVNTRQKFNKMHLLSLKLLTKVHFCSSMNLLSYLTTMQSAVCNRHNCIIMHLSALFK